MIGMGRAITRTPLMAQHVPISFPSPGDEVDGVGGVDKVDGVGGFGGLIVAYDHKHCEMLILILVKHVLVIMMVIVIVKVTVR